MVEGDELDVEIHGVKKTGRSKEHKGKVFDVLEVSLMIQVAEKQRSEFKGWVYPQSVELKSDPDDANLHPDDLKDLMAGAAHDWEQTFGDWETTILSRPEPVDVS